MTDPLSALVALSQTLGVPERDAAILAEGNTSVRTEPGRMLVKASGSSLGSSTSADFVELRTSPLIDLVNSHGASDDEVSEAMRDAKLDPGAPRPSMEALLHAVCMEETDASVFAHTHPVAINALLCSDQAELLVAGSLFPDQVVVLGRHNLLIPYADPGLALARAVRDGLRRHVDQHARPPKVAYLTNHGIFALAADTAEAVAITDMSIKAARILSGALAVGRPRFLSATEAERIDTRPDELLRRKLLAQRGDRA